MQSNESNNVIIKIIIIIIEVIFIKFNVQGMVSLFREPVEELVVAGAPHLREVVVRVGRVDHVSAHPAEIDSAILTHHLIATVNFLQGEKNSFPSDKIIKYA